MNYYLFVVTIGNIEDGKKIARILIGDKLAACVNIIQDITSIYHWKGKIEEDTENLLFIKIYKSVLIYLFHCGNYKSTYAFI